MLALLADRQRAQVVARLTEVVAQGDDAEAAVAVRQLASMPSPPMSPLAAAVASVRRSVSLEAQQAIGDLMRQWQRRINSRRSLHHVAGQITELAAALAAQRDDFSRKDRRWVESTARKLVRLANQLPADASPAVATHCELILASTGTAPESTATTADAHSAMPRAAESASPAAVKINELHAVPIGANSHAVVSAPTVLTGERRPLSFHLSNDAIEEEWSAGPSESEWQPDWLKPMPRANPIEQAPMPPLSPLGNEAATPPRDLKSLDNHQLLALWSTADEMAAPRIEQELAHRGFRQLSSKLVRRLLSETADDRLSLLEELLTAPHIDAKPWLLLLANDPVADVRLAAVSAMATSRDPRLIDKAWQVALHDQDPRIAALVPRLRERRERVERQ